MGYMSIDNLYKDQRVLLFKEVWATEKIHGTSAWITYKGEETPQKLQYHSGGAKFESFTSLFDEQKLLNKMIEIFGNKTVKIHGEHYGGKIQKMRTTYGEKNAFVVFDIRVGDSWLSFDKVQQLGKTLELDVVDGIIVPATVEALDIERDKPSVQAKKNSIDEDKIREGIVIRPLVEMCDNSGKRIIAKHKGESFMETKTPRDVSPEKLKMLEDAELIADEWVTPMRLTHVLDKLELSMTTDITKMRDVIAGMIADVEKESTDEAIINQDAKKYIGKKTAQLFKEHLNSMIKSSKNQEEV